MPAGLPGVVGGSVSGTTLATVIGSETGLIWLGPLPRLSVAATV